MHASLQKIVAPDCFWYISQFFILWKIYILFSFYVVRPCCSTVFTKNCTALNQSDSKIFSWMLLTFVMNAIFHINYISTCWTNLLLLT